jgi:hypothetical protein
MNNDPTLARIRAVRHQISEQYQHNIQRVIDHYIEREKQRQTRFIEFTPYTLSEEPASDSLNGRLLKQPESRGQEACHG